MPEREDVQKKIHTLLEERWDQKIKSGHTTTHGEIIAELYDEKEITKEELEIFQFEKAPRLFWSTVVVGASEAKHSRNEARMNELRELAHEKIRELT